MLILCVSILLTMIAGMVYGGKKRTLSREELLDVQKYSEKIHREEALPFE